jgi:hypothetical protein
MFTTRRQHSFALLRSTVLTTTTRLPRRPDIITFNLGCARSSGLDSIKPTQYSKYNTTTQQHNNTTTQQHNNTTKQNVTSSHRTNVQRNTSATDARVGGLRVGAGIVGRLPCI